MAKYITKEIEIYQGDSYHESFGMEVFDTDVNMFVPRDMTGLRIDMHIKQQASPTLVPIITASTETGEILLYNAIVEADDLAALESTTPVYGSAAYRTMDTDLLYVWDSDSETYIEWKAYEGPIMSWLKVRIPNSQTRLIRGGREYVYDMQIIDGDDVETFRVGPVIVDAEVTDIRP
jgi:hypothetical protein